MQELILTLTSVFFGWTGCPAVYVEWNEVQRTDGTAIILVVDQEPAPCILEGPQSIEFTHRNVNYVEVYLDDVYAGSSNKIYLTYLPLGSHGHGLTALGAGPQPVE